MRRGVASVVFIIFAIYSAGIAFASDVLAQYGATCTGQQNCSTDCGACGLSGCAWNEVNCTTTCDNGAICYPGCSISTSCNSTPPPGCPANRAGCTWVTDYGCGGGTCGCGETRSAALYCNGIHCDDACTTDAICTTGCGGGGEKITFSNILGESKPSNLFSP